MKQEIHPNQFCPCGSGSKYKKCCAAKLEQPATPVNSQIELAANYFANGNYLQVEQIYLDLVAKAPGNEIVLQNLVAIVQKFPDIEQALMLISNAISCNNGFYYLHNMQGILLCNLGRYLEAKKAFKRTIKAAEQLDFGYHGIADAHMALGQRDQAKQYYYEAWSRNPNNQYCKYLYEMLGGINPERAPDDYVIKLFNYYAGNFDQHLVLNLAYKTPYIIADKIRVILTGNQYNALDLGCGTGLVAEALRARDLVQNIVGVDIAPKMIERAAARNLYSSLHCLNIEDFLQNSTGQYDIITALELFLYIGKLDTVFLHISRIMAAGAVFAFSIEALSGDEEYKLQANGRYAQSSAYINKLAALCDLRVILAEKTELRKQGANDAQGEIYILQKLCAG